MPTQFTAYTHHHLSILASFIWYWLVHKPKSCMKLKICYELTTLLSTYYQPIINLLSNSGLPLLTLIPSKASIP